MRRLALALAFGASCLLCLVANGDTLLMPITHADASEICNLFTGKAGGQAVLALPKGVESIVALPDQSAIVAEGSADALARLRERVAQLDIPSRQVGLKVLVVVPPAGKRDLAWLGGATAFFVGGHTGYCERFGTEPVETVIGNLKAKGAKILEPAGGGDRTVSNNHSEAVWFGDNFSWLREGKPLGVGVELRPRLNGDDSVTLAAKWVQAVLDQNGKPRVEAAPGAWAMPQVTVQNGGSMLVGGLLPKQGAADGGPVYLLVRAAVDRTKAAAR